MVKETLFVCRENLGRSQVAATWYNFLKPNQAESAGTIVKNPGTRLMDAPEPKVIISLMLEDGLDISQNTTRKVTPELAEGFGQIIVMAEIDKVPDWLLVLADTRGDIWEVEDLKDKPPDIAREIIEKIKTDVIALCLAQIQD